MRNRTPTVILGLIVSLFAPTSIRADDLARDFVDPPDSVRPWVYAFWLGGNVTKEGITADLEAMKRAGIGGCLFMDGHLGNPSGPAGFMTPLWRDLFKHMLKEADRVGLEVNVNNAPGWQGSGGPWNKPEQAAQKVVFSETAAAGPSAFDAIVARPPVTLNCYQDIALLAFPAPAPGANGEIRRIPDVKRKSFDGAGDFQGCVTWPRFVRTDAAWPVTPPAQCVPARAIHDLTGKMTKDGRLTWDVPAGNWIIMRIGQTPTGAPTRVTQAGGAGLECDKLSKSALEGHFNAFVCRLLDDIGPLTGKTLVSTHIDSWEAGSGNWTQGFREEFLKRRGYDLLPYLPVLNGIIVESQEVSERFLWDMRETVNDLLLENYAGHMRELARQRGLRLSIEAYDGTCDDLRYAGRADEPMAEFWQGGCYGGMNLLDLSEMISSAAHVYGRRVVGAEAFTAWHGRGWLDHPATLKPLADWAFCQGINRFCISEWIFQPWTNRLPGVCFADVGTQYGRGLTWWEQSKAWHLYLARCQHLLRQGLFVADICFLQPEGAPNRFVPPIPAAVRNYPPERPPYNFDGCPAEVLLTRMTVKDQQLMLPDGMSYRLLVLPSYRANEQPVWQLDGDDYTYSARPMPKNDTMTPATLRKIKELVEAGATVLGTRPLKSPSLAEFPDCDRQVAILADELWGKGAGESGEGERKVGKGCVVWGRTPEQVLGGMHVAPDFLCGTGQPFRAVHRRLENGTDLYFVSNKMDERLYRSCFFRVGQRAPELWWPDSGHIERPAIYDECPAGVCVPLHLEPNESVFVIFRAAATPNNHRIVQVVHNGHVLDAASWESSADGRQTSDQDRFTSLLAQVNSPRGPGDSAPYLGWWKTSPYGLLVELLRNADGRIISQIRETGTYEFKQANGKTQTIKVDSLPTPLELSGPWNLRFQPDRGAPEHVNLDRLVSWHQHGNAGVKYYSGEATYRISFTLPADWIQPGRGVGLDLGRVRVIASVAINGKHLGVLWKAPFRLDITAAALTGANTLEVTVANLPVNRMIGDEQLAEDSNRDAAGMVTSWPQWLLDGKPSPTGRITFSSWRLWGKGTPLVESGLLGPVRIMSEARVLVEE